MIGVAGRDKADDILVRADLSEKKGIRIELKSKNKIVFGKSIESAVKEAAKELGVENCDFQLEDFGALDFVIKARVKTAIKRARGNNDEQ